MLYYNITIVHFLTLNNIILIGTHCWSTVSSWWSRVCGWATWTPTRPPRRSRRSVPRRTASRRWTEWLCREVTVILLRDERLVTEGRYRGVKTMRYDRARLPTGHRRSSSRLDRRRRRDVRGDDRRETHSAKIREKHDYSIAGNRCAAAVK